jgi:hypothetical protein
MRLSPASTALAARQSAPYPSSMPAAGKERLPAPVPAAVVATAAGDLVAPAAINGSESFIEG